MSEITKRIQENEDADIPSSKHPLHDDDVDECVIEASTAQRTSSAVSEPFYMYNTYDRPADASTEGVIVQNGTYEVEYEDKPGKRIWKTGYIAEIGYGRAKAEYSVFEAEAKGPNASAKAELSKVGAGAMARAEIASASARAGPLAAKVGLGLDTGASIGAGGLEVKLLGTGFSIGPKISASFFGSEFSFSFW